MDKPWYFMWDMEHQKVNIEIRSWTQISIPPLQVRGALSGGWVGCLCQWELKAPTDRSRSDCVHEQVAKRIANVRFTFAQHFSYHASGKTSENRIGRRIRSYLKLSFKYSAVHSGTSDRTSSVTPCSSNNFRTLEALMTSGFPSGPSVVIRSILMKEMPYFGRMRIIASL